MKRFFSLCAVCAVMCGALTACGAHEQSNSQSHDEAAVAEQAESPAVLPDPRTITGLSTVEELSDPEVIDGDFQQQLPAQITDFQGENVTISDTSRILPLDLTGNISRTLVALGMADSIVGRTVSSTEKTLADRPVVTEQGHSINVEAALELRPTLVITDLTVGPVEAFEQFRASGVPVVVIDSNHGLDNIEAGINGIGAAVGMRDAAAALSQRTRSEVDTARQEIAAWAPEEPLSIAFLYVRGTAGVFFILGPDEGSTALIEGVGGKDVAANANLGSTTPASAEALLAVNPDVYFTMTNGLESTGGMDGLFARAGVADTTAGKNRRVVAIPDGISLSFGPQAADTLRSVAKALYGVE